MDRIDTYINYEQSFLALSKVLSLKARLWMGDFMVSLKNITGIREGMTTERIVKEDVRRNNVLLLMLRNRYKEVMREVVRRMEEWNSASKGEKMSKQNRAERRGY